MRRTEIVLFVVALVVTCAALAHAQQIAWVQSTYGAPKIRMCTTDGTGRTAGSLPVGSLPHGLAFHAKTSSLFWASGTYSKAHIARTERTFASTDTLTNGGLGSPFQGVALDTVAEKVYWTTTRILEGCRIWRADLDGTGEQSIIQYGPAGNQNLRGIALDLQHQKMYWADFGGGQIMTATLDGTIPQSILTGLLGPVGVALDLSGGKVYWCEANGHAIKRANLDGSSPATVVSGLAMPQYLAIDPMNDMMVWTELGGNGRGWIRRATLDGASVTTLLGDAVGDSVQYPGGIALLGSVPATGVDEAPLPAAYALEQNYPNPFNPTTTIVYALPVPGHVRLGVYDVLGREVALLVDGYKGAGVHQVHIDASGLASGVYIYRMQAGPFTQAKGLVIAK